MQIYWISVCASAWFVFILFDFFQVQDNLEVPQKLNPDPVGAVGTHLANEFTKSCNLTQSKEAKELKTLFHKPHFKVNFFECL